MSLLDRALHEAAERDRRRAETQAQRRRVKIEELRGEAVSKLAMILDDDPADEITEDRVDGLREVVDGWEVEGRGPSALPVGLVGDLDGIPLGILPDPGRPYGTAILAARFGEVDGVRFLATSDSIIRTLADVPDCLEELDRNLTDEAAAIAAQEETETSPGPEPDRRDDLAAAISALDADAVRSVAALDLATAAQLIAPTVTAIALDRIADHLRDR